MAIRSRFHEFLYLLTRDSKVCVVMQSRFCCKFCLCLIIEQVVYYRSSLRDSLQSFHISQIESSKAFCSYIKTVRNGAVTRRRQQPTVLQSIQIHCSQLHSTPSMIILGFQVVKRFTPNLENVNVYRYYFRRS